MNVDAKESTPEPHPQRDWVGWAIHLLAWDAVWPVLVASAPFVVKAVFPDKPVVRGGWTPSDFVSIGLPVLAMYFRAERGFGELSRFGRWRLVPFMLALLVIGIGECFYLMMQSIPVPLKSEETTWIALITGTFFAVYLLLMGIAYLPTRRNQPAARDNWLVIKKHVSVKPAQNS
jgi:hypothetical protein